MFFGTFLLVGTLGFGSAIDISSCQNLTTENGVYNLTQDVSSAGSCFEIQANNVTLDCGGNLINFSQSVLGDGVKLDGYNNFTLRNCLIEIGNNFDYDCKGVRIINSKNVIFENNFLLNNGAYFNSVDNVNFFDTFVNSTNAESLYVYDVEYFFINNSYLNSFNSTYYVLEGDYLDFFVINNSEFYGIGNRYIVKFENSYNFSINDNKFYSFQRGIEFNRAGNFNFSNNYFETTDRVLDLIRFFDKNYFFNNVFNSTGVYSLNIAFGDGDSYFYDCDFVGSGFYVIASTSQNIHFFAAENLNLEDSYFAFGHGATFNFYNKLTFRVVDFWNRAVELVLSVLRDVESNILFSKNTNSTGEVGPEYVLEYYFNSSGIYYSSPYILNLSRNDYRDSINNFNLTTSGYLEFRIFESVFPKISFVFPTPENNSGRNNNFVANMSIDEKYLSNITWGFDGVNKSLDIGGFKPVSDLFDGLVSFWNADNLGEDQIFGNNLSFYGDANVSDGVYGEGFSFDGDGDYAKANQTFSTGDSEGFTFSSWIYIDNQESENLATLFSLGQQSETGGFYWGYLYKNSFRLQYSNNESARLVKYSNFPSRYSWMHFTISHNYSNGDLKVYLNGELYENQEGNIPVAPIVSKDIVLGSYKGGSHYFNGSMDEVMIFNRSLSDQEVNQLYKTFSRKFGADNYSVYYNDTLVSGNSEINIFSDDLNWTNYQVLINQSGLEVGSSYEYFLGATDLSGNYNQTEVRLINGNTAPFLSGVFISPNDLNYIDPNENVSIEVNITDYDNNLNVTYFEVFNETSFSWERYEMQNITVKDIYTTFNFSYLLPSDEGDIIYRIVSVDFVGAVGYSENMTIENFWDCTWQTDLDFDVGVGYNENKNLGNMTIENTGDSEFEGGCSLDFRISYNLEEGTIFYDGETYKNVKFFTIPAESELNISINASFSSEIKEEIVSLIVEDFRGRSNQRYNFENFTLVTNEDGPYFFLDIESYPQSVYLKNEDFSLSGYLRNLMGDVVVNENNTAYNVSYYWSLPSGLSVNSGNESVFIENISDKSKHESLINLGFSNLASFVPGVKSVSLKAEGIDNNYSEILDASGKVFSKNVSINFLCNPESDGVYVVACGSLDGDYVAPSVGGSSGGGGGSSRDEFQTSEELQIVRGEENEIEVVFENPSKENSLYDLEFFVFGDIAKYIEVLPKNFYELKPKENLTVKLVIVSPSYIDVGRQNIVVEMRARDGNRVYIEKRKLGLEIHDLSSETAKELLNKSRYLVNDLIEVGLSSDYLMKLVTESANSISSFDYEKIQENYEVIEKQVFSALKTKNSLDELKRFSFVSEEKGIDIKKTLRLMKLSELSLSRGDFEKAYQLIQDAQMSYALETRGKIGKVIYYLKNYPYEILGSLISLFLISFFAYKLIYLKVLNRKLKVLEHKKEVFEDLIKTLQVETFEKNKMSMSEYSVAIEEYRKNISEVTERLIELDTRKIFLFRFVSKKKRIYFERDRILIEIKKLQKKYLKDKKIESNQYEANMESYTARLSEIEEKIATAEAKAEYKKIRRKRK